MRSVLLALAIPCFGCTPPVRDDVANAPVQTEGPSLKHPPEIQGHATTLLLVGKYYRGDGTGFNLTLSLNEGGTFKCDWAGCLGAYGSSSGTWSEKGDQITTETLKEDGMMVGNPIGTLAVIEDDGKHLLVQNSDREFFDEHGPSRYACFSPVQDD